MKPKKSKSKNEITNTEIYKKLKSLNASSYNNNHTFEDNMARFARRLGISTDHAIILLHIGDWLPDLLRLNTDEYPAEMVIRAYDNQKAQALPNTAEGYTAAPIYKSTAFLPEDGFSDFIKANGTQWLQKQMELNDAGLPKDLISFLEDVKERELKVLIASDDESASLEEALIMIKKMLWFALDQLNYVVHLSMQPTPATGKVLYYQEELEYYFRDGARGVFERFNKAGLMIPARIVSEVIFAEKHCIEVEQHQEVDVDVRADNLLTTTDHLWRVLEEEGYCIPLKKSID